MSLVQTYFDRCSRIIEAHDGTLATTTGDGFQAYFGYPIAREDSAVDAVMAALEVQHLMSSGRESTGLRVTSRIGIATGRVVVSAPDQDRPGHPMAAFGSTPHLAARLEQAAKPGHILIDQATKELCRERFSFRGMETIVAKGFDQRVETWQVLDQQPSIRRFATPKLSCYVGRRSELEALTGYWKKSESGHGQTVMIIGDAGIGKSRLLYELQRTLPKDRVAIFQFQCSRQHTSTPLHPWIHSVQRFAKLQNVEAETRRARLKHYLATRLKLPDYAFEASAPLFGVADKATRDDSDISPQQMLLRLQDALVHNLNALSSDYPILLSVEDVQWIDASTLRVISELAAGLADKRIFLALTARTSQEPDLGTCPLQRLELGRLDDGPVHELIAELTSHSQDRLDQQSTDAIRQKSNGIPLYVEELTKHYLIKQVAAARASGAPRPDALVPNVLQLPLLEQLNDAGDSNRICQLAAVIGHEFDAGLLVDLLNEPMADVLRSLEDLTNARILEKVSFGDQTKYLFRHALLQDAVYSSLLNATRMKMHRLVAEYLSNYHADTQSGAADVIAYHFENADEKANAFHHWFIAGQRALDSGATREAASVLARAAKYADALEETEQDTRTKAAFHRAYGYSLNASGGVAADPIQQYRYAEGLSVAIDDVENALESMHCIAGLHFNAGELIESEGPALRMKELGSTQDYALATIAGCQALGMARFMQGRFDEARLEFTQGLEVAPDFLSGIHCFPSMSLSYLAWTHYFLGDFADAKDCAERAIASAYDESSHAVAAALGNCGYVYQSLKDVDKVKSCSDDLIRHAERRGEMMYLKRGIILLSWADFVAKPSTQPVTSIEANIDLLLQAEEKIETTFLLGILAELQLAIGQFEAAEESLNTAFRISEETREYFYLSQLYQLKARLREAAQTPGSQEDATKYWRTAKEIAIRQNAQALVVGFE